MYLRWYYRGFTFKPHDSKSASKRTKRCRIDPGTCHGGEYELLSRLQQSKTDERDPFGVSEWNWDPGELLLQVDNSIIWQF